MPKKNDSILAVFEWSTELVNREASVATFTWIVGRFLPSDGAKVVLASFNATRYASRVIQARCVAALADTSVAQLPCTCGRNRSVVKLSQG